MNKDLDKKLKEILKHLEETKFRNYLKMIEIIEKIEKEEEKRRDE